MKFAASTTLAPAGTLAECGRTLSMRLPFDDDVHIGARGLADAINEFADMHAPWSPFGIEGV